MALATLNCSTECPRYVTPQLYNAQGKPIPAYAKKQYVNPVDNPVALSSEVVLGIEEWLAIQVSELGDGGKDGGTYGFDKFLAVLNRRCPSVLRIILDAGADIYV